MIRARASLQGASVVKPSKLHGSIALIIIAISIILSEPEWESLSLIRA